MENQSVRSIESVLQRADIIGDLMHDISALIKKMNTLRPEIANVIQDIIRLLDTMDIKNEKIRNAFLQMKRLLESWTAAIEKSVPQLTQGKEEVSTEVKRIKKVFATKIGQKINP
jgi:predicted  nucleic acid-binding Zn-ribbon protein